MKKILWVLIVPAVLVILAGCASVPPVINSELQKVYYISPKNGDGVQDTLSVPITIEAAKRHVIKGYTITVTDQQGTVVKEETAEAASLNFWKKLGTAFGFVKKEGVEIPEVLIWDGRNNDQKFVPDGFYQVALSAWDDKKQTVKSGPIDVTVDNTPPEAELTIPYRIFSPNGDGNKEVLPVTQTGSTEDLWEGVFRNASGKEILHLQWEKTPAEQIEWKGTDDSGKQVPDGTFSYEIFSTDRAGNKGSAKITDIGINTKPSVIGISSNYNAFSPNGDGVQDTVTFSPVFPEEGVDGWTLSVLDKNGRRLQKIQGVDQFVYTWDGTDSEKQKMPDGEYTVEFDVLYENGNNPRVTGGPIILDTVYPAVKVSADYTLFSPDGDGHKDAISIRHRDATDEHEWKGELLAKDGEVLLSHMWEGTPPDILWDGKNDAGNAMPDGEYMYRISSTDAAGNAFTTIMPGIRIDNRQTPLSLSLSSSAFSPNNDDVRDAVTITPRAGLSEGIIRWTVSILDAKGKTVKTDTGTKLEPYSWNGLTDNGTYAEDGEYTAKMELIYEKGNQPVSVSEPFILDTVYPSAVLSADYLLFSPDGDGARDTVTLKSSSASREGMWKGEITGPEGKVLRTASWENTPENFTWDGKDSSGKTVPDGSYLYRVSSTDEAGNAYSTELKGIRIDTRPTPIAVQFDKPAFSPNGDGVLDRVTVIPQVGLPEGITSWQLKILDGKGNTIYTKKTAGPVTAFDWDGKTDKGTTAPDGNYTADFEAVYANGKNPKTTSEAVTIDTVAPKAEVSSPYTLFSPDGDGRKDSISIGQKTSAEQVWTGVFMNSAGAQIRQVTWKGSAQNLVWDGRDGSGKPVSDGVYVYKISATDAAGNTGEAELPGIRIDTRAAQAQILSNASGFSPNEDGYKDTMPLTMYVGLMDGISSWSVAAVEKTTGKKTVIASGKETPVPEIIRWDGKGPDGSNVKEGNYTARLTIEYAKGNLVEEGSEDFILDTTPPAVSISAAPLPFSPDDDGTNDTVTISMKASDQSPIDSWTLQLLDPRSNLFTEYSASGEPDKSIVWDGKSSNGELVQAASDYTLSLRVRDYYGNVGKASSVLPVDIYVLREGERLKIQISSIYFAPFSADFQHGKEDAGMRTLRRLAEILKKFPDYQISIEGHAVRVYWFNEAKGAAEEKNELAPLSQARAQRVKEILESLGIEKDRMTAIGFGGTRPIVPHSDLDNRWKNRRVEFILKRR